MINPRLGKCAHTDSNPITSVIFLLQYLCLTKNGKLDLDKLEETNKHITTLSPDAIERRLNGPFQHSTSLIPYRAKWVFCTVGLDYDKIEKSDDVHYMISKLMLCEVLQTERNYVNRSILRDRYPEIGRHINSGVYLKIIPFRKGYVHLLPAARNTDFEESRKEMFKAFKLFIQNPTTLSIRSAAAIHLNITLLTPFDDDYQAFNEKHSINISIDHMSKTIYLQRFGIRDDAVRWTVILKYFKAVCLLILHELTDERTIPHKILGYKLDSVK